MNRFDSLIQFHIQQTYNKIHFPLPSPYLEMSFPFPPIFLFLPVAPAFSQLSMKTQDLPLLFLLPDFLPYINSIDQILLIFNKITIPLATKIWSIHLQLPAWISLSRSRNQNIKNGPAKAIMSTTNINLWALLLNNGRSIHSPPLMGTHFLSCINSQPSSDPACKSISHSAPSETLHPCSAPPCVDLKV